MYIYDQCLLIIFIYYPQVFNILFLFLYLSNPCHPVLALMCVVLFLCKYFFVLCEYDCVYNLFVKFVWRVVLSLPPPPLPYSCWTFSPPVKFFLFLFAHHIHLIDTDLIKIVLTCFYINRLL